MKRILLTGAGFIGSNFIEMYHKDYEITVFDNFNYASQANRVEHLTKRTQFVRCEDMNMVEANFEGITELEGPFDLVICAHAETHNCNSIERPGDFVQSNIVGTYNILEMCRKYEIPLIYISTDETIKHYKPFEEWEPPNMIGKQTWFYRVNEEDSILSPTSPYSSTKAAAELLVNSWRTTYGLPATIVRPVNQYGPGQHVEKLIPRVVSKALAGEKVPVFKTRAWRDWCFVEDLCRALQLLIETDNREDLYHVSAYNETETLDMVKMVLEIINYNYFPTKFIDESCIEMVEDRKAYDLYYSLDSSKIRDLGWKPQVTLEEGLTKTVQHFMEQYDVG